MFFSNEIQEIVSTPRFSAPICDVQIGGIGIFLNNSYIENRALLKQTRSSQSLLLDGLRLLVVDNNDDSLRLIKLIFEDVHTQIKTAKSVDDAIQIIEEWKPDILISDIGLPSKDGYSLIRFIRHKEASCGGFLPAVALTSYVASEYLNKAKDAGFQAFICKPFDLDELVETVVNLINDATLQLLRTAL
jgi:CheY-like chemotaxis protein